MASSWFCRWLTSTGTSETPTWQACPQRRAALQRRLRQVEALCKEPHVDQRRHLLPREDPLYEARIHAQVGPHLCRIGVAALHAPPHRLPHRRSADAEEQRLLVRLDGKRRGGMLSGERRGRLAQRRRDRETRGRSCCSCRCGCAYVAVTTSDVGRADLALASERARGDGGAIAVAARGSRGAGPALPSESAS